MAFETCVNRTHKIAHRTFKGRMEDQDDKTPLASGLHRRDWIAGLDRGLAILEVFDRDHPRLTATEVGRATGLTRSAARRYLLTLEHLGYLSSDGKQFGLTPRVLKIGWSYFDSAALPGLLRPYLQRITASTGESVYAGVLDGRDVVFIARNVSNRVMASAFALGARTPAQLAVAGIMLLSFLTDEALQTWLGQVSLAPTSVHTILDKTLLLKEIEQARGRGYAVLEQQQQVGVRGICVPLLNRDGAVVAALSVSMPMGRESKADAVARILPVLQETANGLIAVL
jgi:IclR family pca regulon transcriptional regulator